MVRILPILVVGVVTLYTALAIGAPVFPPGKHQVPL